MIVLIQVIICLSAAAYDCIWVNMEGFKISYLGYGINVIPQTKTQDVIIAFMLWFIALMNFVSISLLVTLEMVKLTQGYFIE